MPAESPRIAELRRRIEADPASIAFAQLAEEYRRAGNFEAAEQCCRSGLIRHPGYLSARVTLGRTLIELDRLDQAEQELQLVLNSAPDNLAAIRGMAEIHQRRGHLEAALEYYRRALPLARHDPDLEETVSQIKRELGAVRPAPNAAMLSFAEAENELLSAASRMPDARRPEPPPPAAPSPPPPMPVEQPPAAASPSLASQRDAIDISSPFEPEVSIDFDSLLKSLGAADYAAPPMVEALLTEPAPAAPRPEPVLPELPIEKPPADPHAALRRGLQEFDAPASARPEPDASFGAASSASARPEPDASYPPPLARPSDASFGEASGAASSASARTESDASYGVTSPVAPVAPAAPEHPPSLAQPPDASVPPSLARPSEASFGEASGAASPAAPETSKEQMILDELEAWLAAIKR